MENQSITFTDMLSDIATLAEATSLYFKQLVEQGFKEKQALELTKVFLSFMFGGGEQNK